VRALHIIINWTLVRLALQRYITHALLLAVLLSVVGLSRFEVPGFQLTLPAGLASADQTAGLRVRGNPALARGGPQSDRADDRLVRVASVHTQIPERPRRDIITYTVQAGDTPLSIAKQFGLDPRTILWGNPGLGSNPELLQMGQVLNILPVDGVLHEVVEGDTLESVAAAYLVDPEVIRNYAENQVPKDGRLAAGEALVVPGGQRDLVVWSVPVRQVSSGTSGSGGSYYTGPVLGAGGGSFAWPLGGIITQYYWWGHRGIDIATPMGTAIAAADGGTVVYAGWSPVGYGNLVVIDHGNGFQTYYAHQSLIVVENGQWLTAGQLIGYVGSTGRSTGPHLHLEIRFNDVPLNPFDYLP
jgi:murein DD-endopeptidase MepM/ murein hydrolase activator NlpD